jgi:hypothetical protein
MTRDSRNQSPSKESQEHANTKHDERDKIPSPDIDFPEPTGGTGEDTK